MEHDANPWIADLAGFLAQSRRQEGQASKLQAVALGAHAGEVAGVLTAQAAQIILGLDDAELLKLGEQSLIDPEIVFILCSVGSHKCI